MVESIILSTNEKYWLKTKFKVWIKTPADSDSISGSRYRELAIEAIKEWKAVLDEFANSNQTHSRLRNIEFEIINENDFTTTLNVSVPKEKLGNGYNNSRSLLSVSSCGICGKTELNDLEFPKEKMKGKNQLDIALIPNLFNKMRNNQHDFEQSGGTGLLCRYRGTPTRLKTGLRGFIFCPLSALRLGSKCSRTICTLRF